MEISLSGIKSSDAVPMVEHLHDKEIYRLTLKIPYPYGLSDARWFINDNLAFEQKHKLRKNWAIRNEEETMMGVIGLHYPFGIGSHTNEIGYWLGRKYWGKGYMTQAVRMLCEHVFNEMDIVRLQAITFENNIASTRVLSKNGFQYEGTLQKYYKKDHKLLNGKVYAKIQH